MEDQQNAKGQLENFFNFTLDMQCIASIDGFFLRINQAFTDTLGWNIEELLERPYLDFVHPDDIESTQRVMHDLVIGEKVLSFKNRYRHKNGSWRVLSWRALPDGAGFVYATARDVTEQQEFEETLLKSQESLSVMLQSIGDGVIATDNDGKVTLLNGVAQGMTGWSMAEAVGQPISKVFRIVNEHSRSPAEIPVERVLRTGSVQGLDSHTVLISRDGNEWHIADSASPIKASDSRTLGVIMVFQDVTGERNAIRTQEHLAAIVKSSHDAIMSETLEGIILSWNPAAQQMFGFSAQEAIGQSMEIRIPSDRLAEANELLKKSAAGELIDNFETVRVRKDGSRLDVSITVSPIRDEAGLIVGSSKTFRDITEAKRNEAQLNRERRLLDAILETVIDGILTIDGILVTDEAGTILKANQSALNQFGFSIDELIGMNVGSLVPALVQETPDFNLQASQGNWFADLIGPVRETVGCRKDGAEWPLEISVGVSLLDDAKIFTAVIRDITERKAAQNLLLEARKEAEQSSLAKSDFLSHMSHELRTPLNAVLGYAQLMQMESEDANTLDSAKSIIKAGRHLLTLINEVLDLARIQSGSFGISLEPVSLHELIRECLEFVRPIASDKGIIIEVDARHAEHLYAMADKQRIRQAVLNLLSNAIKYNRQNGRINVRILSSNAYCRIQVSDTGPGISLENRAKLFVPFERLGEHSVEGTGLGLSLSQNLVKHMGGTLQLLDTSEAGSTFEIQLHVAPSLLSPDDSVPALDESSVGLADEPLLILYIEDNLSNIQLMERALKSVQGAELIVATRAQMGIELALTRIPDLVLLDVHLPDGNGAEVLRKLKAEPKSAHIPIVVVSADATDKQIERLIQAGAKTYLTKPLELNALYAEINDVKMKKAEARVV